MPIDKRRSPLEARIEAALERGLGDLAESFLDQGIAAARAGLLGEVEMTPFSGGPHEILGVSPTATEAEAREGFIRRAKQEFQTLYQAYMQFKGR